MGKEDKRKRAAQEAEAEADETVNLFREEKDPANRKNGPADTARDSEGSTAGEAETKSEEENACEGEDTSEASKQEKVTPDSEAAEQNGEGAAEDKAAAGETGESGNPAEPDEADGKKKGKKDKRDEKIAELSDKLLRQQAEFINFRNRTEKEKAQMFEVGARSAFEKILPVIDNFERGLATLSEEEKTQPFAVGIDKTYKQLITALTEAGVTPIEAVGQPFNPDLHNAVMHVEDESVGENTVVEEFQKGYRYRDSVLRHSMVKVAN